MKLSKRHLVLSALKLAVDFETWRQDAIAIEMDSERVKSSVVCIRAIFVNKDDIITGSSCDGAVAGGDIATLAVEDVYLKHANLL